MQITLDLLNELEKNMTSKDYAPHIVRSLDIRMRMLYDTLYDPNKKKEEQRILPSIEEREEELRTDKAQFSEQNPLTILKLGVDRLLHDMYDRFDNDLSAHFSEDDERGGLTLAGVKAKLSFALFCSHISSQNPSRDKAKNNATAQKLEQQGYIIRTKPKGGKELVDCDTNRNLIRAYIEKIGGKHIRFETPPNGNDIIYTVYCIIDPEQYPLFNKPEPQQNTDKDPYFLPKEHIFTEDELYQIKKLINDIKFALGGVQFIEDNNLIADLLKSYIYQLEGMYGVKGRIYEEQDAECRPKREKNEAIRQSFDRIKQQAVEQKHTFCGILRNIFEDLNAKLENESVEINSIQMCRYGALYVTITPNINVLLRKQPNGTIFIRDEVCDEWVIPASQENLIKISDILKKHYPAFELYGQIKCRWQTNGAVILKVNGRILL